MAIEIGEVGGEARALLDAELFGHAAIVQQRSCRDRDRYTPQVPPNPIVTLSPSTITGTRRRTLRIRQHPLELCGVLLHVEVLERHALSRVVITRRSAYTDTRSFPKITTILKAYAQARKTAIIRSLRPVIEYL